MMERIVSSPRMVSMSLRLPLALASCALLVACSDDSGSVPTQDVGNDIAADDATVGDTDAADAADAAPDLGVDAAADALPDATEVTYPDDPPDTVGGDRPAQVLRPSDYDPDRAWPLVVLLHGFGASGLLQDAYVGVSTHLDELGFVLLRPDGTLPPGGSRYWNATEACCAFGDSDVDDVAYLNALVAEVSETHHIDAGRVYVFGHSNGGFMALRLACETPGTFAAVASLAGATVIDPDDCPADGPPVSVLQIHGTADDTIFYDGGTISVARAEYPSALETVRTHAAKAGCDADGYVEGERLDLDAGIEGIDTDTLVWTAGCPDDVDMALWTIDGGDHIPPLSGQGTPQLLAWLLAHER